MRDPKRIPEILGAMGLLWMQAGWTDFRANQLLMTAARRGGWDAEPQDCACGKCKTYCQDPWYVEDDVLLRGLKLILEEINQ